MVSFLLIVLRYGSQYQGFIDLGDVWDIGKDIISGIGNLIGGGKAPEKKKVTPNQNLVPPTAGATFVGYTGQTPEGRFLIWRDPNNVRIDVNERTGRTIVGGWKPTPQGLPGTKRNIPPTAGARFIGYTNFYAPGRRLLIWRDPNNVRLDVDERTGQIYTDNPYHRLRDAARGTPRTAVPEPARPAPVPPLLCGWKHAR